MARIKRQLAYRLGYGYFPDWISAVSEQVGHRRATLCPPLPPGLIRGHPGSLHVGRLPGFAHKAGAAYHGGVGGHGAPRTGNPGE